MAKVKVKKGQKVPEECLQAAQKALSLFDQDEIREFASGVMARARTYTDIPGQAAIQRALKEMGEEEKAILMSRCATKANNIFKFEFNKKQMDKGVDVYNMISRTSKSKDYNARSAIEAAANYLRTEFFEPLSTKQIDLIRTNETDIAAAFDGKETGNPLAHAVAKQLKNLFDKTESRLVESNAMAIEHLNPKRMLGNVHDRSKMLTGGRSTIGVAQDILKRRRPDQEAIKKQWVEDVKGFYDLEESFQHTDAFNPDGSLNMAKVDERLSRIFDNIVNDYSEIFTRSVVANDREALAKRSRMFLIPKSLSDQLAYNKKYGQGDLINAIMQYINSSASRIGMAEVFGDSPDTMFIDLKKYQKEVRPVSKTKERLTDLMFNEVRGANKTDYSPTLGNIFRATRALTYMSRLAILPLQSLSDIAQIGAFSMRHGFGFWGAFGYGLRNSFNLIKSDVRARVAKDLNLALRHQLGYVVNFAETNNMGSLSHKMSNAFFHYNGMQAFDYGNKSSMSSWLAMGYGDQSHIKFDSLGYQTKKQLELHGFTEHEWEALRVKSETIKGQKVFLLDNVNKLSPSEMKEMWEKGSKDVPLSQYRDHVYRKVFSLFDIGAENAILNPGDFENVVATWGGHRPGTPSGELIREFMQFKKFTIGNVNRIWVQGMADMDSTQARMLYAANIFAATLPLSAASLYFSQAAKGLTMPDWNEMSLSQRNYFALQLILPGAGFLLRQFDPGNQNPHEVLSLLMSPSLLLAIEPLYTASALVTGNAEQAKKDAVETFKLLNPIQTVPYFEPYMNAFLGKQPFLLPGQEQRHLFGL